MSDSPINQPAIEINHVSKLFRRQKQRTFKEMLPALLGGKPVVDSFWALNDIDLTIYRGETIGIIGPNGSGKSTLLKLIAGVSQPTKGSVKVHGRIAPLIELGAGFHPELTGRENVYLNGVILGMLRSEVEAKFKDIVDFAELWEFIDTPVKHYSSGMYLRLAFAVAVHTDPEILLVDEILAVGDEGFQKKCLNAIQRKVREHCTLFLVSHSREMLLSHTKKSLLLSRGEVISQGSTAKVLADYASSPSATSSDTENSTWGDKKAIITKVELLDERSHVTNKVASGDNVHIAVTYHNPEQLDLKCAIGIYREDDLYAMGLSSLFDDKSVNKEAGIMTLELPKLTLAAGAYYVRVSLFSSSEQNPHYFWHRAVTFSVTSPSLSRGVMLIPHHWSLS